MNVYAKLATPGELHSRMASRAGSWNTVTKEWTDPQKPPTESTGACEHTMVLGGRFLRQECTGDMMGQPFIGLGFLGYDNKGKKYVSMWMDSMGTGIFHMEGKAGKDANRITLLGRYDDPLQGPMKLRAVTKLIDMDHEVFEMYGAGKNNTERKMLEIVYTRK
ncbi:MAG TPA: DUF1579 domain-containing protein [Nitrospira sp.]|nr:DUF1579 domain-containing protein [Nitrospira sp.]